jgi:hypothetical protein
LLLVRQLRPEQISAPAARSGDQRAKLGPLSDRVSWGTIGLGSTDLLIAKTLRRRLLAIPGRLTRSARRHRLHLPTDWPWAEQFVEALACLRALPQPT